MKQKLLIFLAIFVVVAILIGLNAASYVQQNKTQDSELNPNRSTYNNGATGTRAFYNFLAESGYKVKRWRDPIAKLKYFDSSVASTFVVIGKLRREFTEDELAKLMNWVSSGGTLVVIDRDPPQGLIASTAYYSFEINGEGSVIYNVDPASQAQMTADTKAARALQPSQFTIGVNAIQPSKFASSIKFSRMQVEANGEPDDDANEMETVETEETPDAKNENSNSLHGESPPNSVDQTSNLNSNIAEPDQAPKASDVLLTREGEVDDTDGETEEELVDIAFTAPVAHFGSDGKTLLADFPFEAGRVVFLTDPYIVANGGIQLADNIQLAANIVGAPDKIIAFDEYHQGYGNNKNLVFAYFSGTPIAAIFLQLVVIIGLIMFSQSRRFARALPLRVPNRLSKLEYVSAMAQLQRRTKAFDLAIENIYSDFRRRVSRLMGVDNHTTSREDLAQLIAARTEYDTHELEELMFKCEDIMLGEPTNRKETVQLTRRLREIETRLGMARTGRKR